MMRSMLAFLILALGSSLSFAAEPEVCEVHKEKMTVKEVPIFYGLPLFTPYDEKLAKASIKLFPHAVDHVEGGCIVGEQRKQSVQECSTCRSQKQAWIKKHPKPKS